jgi:polysaccharide biosynthesis/export protein
MRNRLCLITSLLLLTGCNLMPGMQNPDQSNMVAISSPARPFKPILIPITPSLVASQHFSKYVYRIAPADVLNIIIWQHPEFTQKELFANQSTGMPSTQGAAGKEGYLVNSNGYIHFPLIGDILVAGKTTDEIRIDITHRLRKYLKHLEMNVRVVDYRGQKVYVFGETVKSGFVPITDQPLSITYAISLSEGLNQNAADPEHIYIIRGNIYRPSIYWLNAKTPEGLLLADHFILKAGDILFVSSAPAARWNRVINQLLPTIQTVWYTKAIVN